MLADKQGVTTRSLSHLSLHFTGKSDEKFHLMFFEGVGSVFSPKPTFWVAVDLFRIAIGVWHWVEMNADFIISSIREYTVAGQRKSCRFLHQEEIKNGNSCRWSVMLCRWCQENECNCDTTAEIVLSLFWVFIFFSVHQPTIMIYLFFF